MSSLRVLSFLVLLAVIALLWQNGGWQQAATRLRAFAQSVGSEHAKPVSARTHERAQAPAGKPASMQPAAEISGKTILTWRDKDGVTHFASAGTEAPKGARPHTLGEPGTLDDFHEAFVKEQDAAQAGDRLRFAPEGKPLNQATGNTGDSSFAATQQVRELVNKVNTGLEEIRQENSR